MTDTYLKKAEALKFGDEVGNHLGRKMITGVTHTPDSVRLDWEDGSETWHDKGDWFILAPAEVFE